MSVFLIVHGKRQVTERAGYVAEFCPVCRGIVPLEVIQLKDGHHVYFIPVSDGEVVGYMGRCTVCGLRRPVNPAAYRSVQEARPGRIVELIAGTFPDIKKRYLLQLSLGARLKSTPGTLPLTSSEREMALTETFDLMAGYADGLLRTASTFDGAAKLAASVTLMVWLLVLSVGIRVGSERAINSMLPATGIILLAGLGLTIFQMMKARKRVVVAEVLPLLARALKPLSPPEAELTVWLKGRGSNKARLGRYLEATQLRAAIQEAPSG